MWRLHCVTFLTRSQSSVVRQRRTVSCKQHPDDDQIISMKAQRNEDSSYDIREYAEKELKLIGAINFWCIKVQWDKRENLQLDCVTGEVGRDLGEVLVGAVYRGGPADALVGTGQAEAEQPEEEYRTDETCHRDCHFVFQSLNHHHSPHIRIR